MVSSLRASVTYPFWFNVQCGISAAVPPEGGQEELLIQQC